MRTVLFAVVVLFGCGGGGGSGGDDDDTPTDGSNPTDGQNPTPDGPTVVSALGTTCTPDAANPQGTCPTGFECLNVQGATNPWCSKTCTMGAGDMCGADYTGPGKPACILTVTDENNQNPRSFCSVICMDLTTNNGLCQAGQCNGTCPGSLMCTGDITNTAPPPPVIGKACE